MVGVETGDGQSGWGGGDHRWLFLDERDWITLGSEGSSKAGEVWRSL